MNRMSRTLLVLFAIGLVALNPAGAQEKKPVPEGGAKAPAALAKDYAKAMPAKVGPLATANEFVMITARGSFGLSFDTLTNSTVFEYTQKGFDSKTKFLTAQSGFIYFDITDWQIVVAVRETSPYDVYLFVNGGPTPIPYTASSVFYPMMK